MRKLNKVFLMPLTLVLLAACLAMQAFALGSLSITVSPKEVDTEKSLPGQSVCVAPIAMLVNARYVPETGLEDLPLQLIFSEDGNHYAGQVRDRILERGLARRTGTTDAAGDAVFSGLDVGLYLIFPEKEGMFAPFFVTLLNKDLLCEPKSVLDPPDPTTEPTRPPEPPTNPTRPWSLWPKTGDAFPVEVLLFTSLSSMGAIVLLAVQRKKRADSQR